MCALLSNCFVVGPKASCQVAHSRDELCERLKSVVIGVADPQDECLGRLNLLRGGRG